MPPLREKRSQGRSLKVQKKAAVRASITFPPDLYENLGEIAKHKKVSLALGSASRIGKVYSRSNTSYERKVGIGRQPKMAIDSPNPSCPVKKMLLGHFGLAVTQPWSALERGTLPGPVVEIIPLGERVL